MTYARAVKKSVISVSYAILNCEPVHGFTTFYSLGPHCAYPPPVNPSGALNTRRVTAFEPDEG